MLDEASSYASSSINILPIITIDILIIKNIQGDSEISLEKKCGVSLTQNNSA
jgi:hypothetical protein